MKTFRLFVVVVVVFVLFGKKKKTTKRKNRLARIVLHYSNIVDLFFN